MNVTYTWKFLVYVSHHVRSIMNIMWLISYHIPGRYQVPGIIFSAYHTVQFFRLQKINRKIAYCCIRRCSLVRSASSPVSAFLLLLLLLLLHYVLLVGPARCFILYSNSFAKAIWWWMLLYRSLRKVTCMNMRKKTCTSWLQDVLLLLLSFLLCTVVLRRPTKPTKEYTHPHSMTHRRLPTAGIEVAPHYHQLLVQGGCIVHPWCHLACIEFFRKANSRFASCAYDWVTSFLFCMRLFHYSSKYCFKSSDHPTPSFLCVFAWHTKAREKQNISQQ